MMQAAGLNLLVDPVMYTLDFGVPALIQGEKKASGRGRAKCGSNARLPIGGRPIPILKSG